MNTEMTKGIKFDVSKIVRYLEAHKGNLEKYWDRRKGNINIHKISHHIGNIDFENLSRFDQEIQLKKILKKFFDEETVHNSTYSDLYKTLYIWIIRDWGGITSSDDEYTIKLIDKFLLAENGKHDFKRIASTSKIASFIEPTENTIYDSRVAYSLNWIILSTDAGSKFFPIPYGRNSKMTAFDLNVLIKLKNINMYTPTDTKSLGDKRFINKIDKQLYINEKEAYSVLRSLIKAISKELWKGDKDREDNLYYTEMLLFIMADNEVYMDIVSQVKMKIE